MGSGVRRSCNEYICRFWSLDFIRVHDYVQVAFRGSCPYYSTPGMVKFCFYDI